LDRCALFVDAGYALGDGALAVHGTRNRDSVSWDYAGLLKLLSSLSRDRTGLPLLRCYWYDGAGAGSRAAEHDALADLPGVKLRLSKARPSRKDGVDAEMRRDLTALARNRSVTDVIIVSAEEDLASVIAEVQEFGVRAVLLHIGLDGSWAGSRALRQECDEVIEISAGHLRPYVDLIAGAEPQLAAIGYRELPAGAQQVSGPHAVPESAGPRLFDSPSRTGYEQAAQLASVDGHAHDPRNGLPSSDLRAASVHDSQAMQPGQPQAAVSYHRPDVSGPGLGVTADAGMGQAAFGGSDGAHSANGHGGAGQAHDFSQRGGPPDMRPHGGPAMGAGMDQQAMGLRNSPGPGGFGAHALPGTSMGDGLSGNGNGVTRTGGHARGLQPAGGAVNGVPGNGVPDNGMPGNGMPGPGLSGSGLPAHGVPGNGLPGEPPPPVLQPGVIGQGGSAGGPHHELSGHPFPPVGPGQQPPTGQPQPGQRPHALPPPQQQVMPDLPQSAQALPQAAPPSAGQHSVRELAVQQNGLAPFDSQRPALPQRQLPAANGLPYGQDRGAPYPGQLSASPQFGGPVGEQPYGSGSYGAPQPSAPPAAQLPVGEAVQSAHAEGFGFGEAVARDAPALWLEAVLARKPRMPSDLEARLLQGSALPIDSLLHDEVRHALRRGFWDALERSRH